MWHFVKSYISLLYHAGHPLIASQVLDDFTATRRSHSHISSAKHHVLARWVDSYTSATSYLARNPFDGPNKFGWEYKSEVELRTMCYEVGAQAAFFRALHIRVRNDVYRSLDDISSVLQKNITPLNQEASMVIVRAQARNRGDRWRLYGDIEVEKHVGSSYSHRDSTDTPSGTVSNIQDGSWMN